MSSATRNTLNVPVAFTAMISSGVPALFDGNAAACTTVSQPRARPRSDMTLRTSSRLTRSKPTTS